MFYVDLGSPKEMLNAHQGSNNFVKKTLKLINVWVFSTTIEVILSNVHQMAPADLRIRHHCRNSSVYSR